MGSQRVGHLTFTFTYFNKINFKRDISCKVLNILSHSLSASVSWFCYRIHLASWTLRLKRHKDHYIPLLFLPCLTLLIYLKQNQDKTTGSTKTLISTNHELLYTRDWEKLWNFFNLTMKHHLYTLGLGIARHVFQSVAETESFQYVFWLDVPKL